MGQGGDWFQGNNVVASYHDDVIDEREGDIRISCCGTRGRAGHLEMEYERVLRVGKREIMN